MALETHWGPLVALSTTNMNKRQAHQIQQTMDALIQMVAAAGGAENLLKILVCLDGAMALGKLPSMAERIGEEFIGEISQAVILKNFELGRIPSKAMDYLTDKLGASTGLDDKIQQALQRDLPPGM